MANKALTELAKRYQKNQAQLKKIYAEQDKLLIEAQNIMKTGYENAHDMGETSMILHDNFEDQNACFRTVTVKRFELEFLATEKVIKKLETAKKK